MTSVYLVPSKQPSTCSTEARLRIESIDSTSDNQSTTFPIPIRQSKNIISFDTELIPVTRLTTEWKNSNCQEAKSLWTVGFWQFISSENELFIWDFTEKGQTADPKLKDLASDGYYSTDLKNYLNTYPLLCDGLRYPLD